MDNKGFDVNNNTVVDLFSGAGGLELGFEQAGFNIVFSTDIDEYCEKVHLQNRPHIPFVRSDIRGLETPVLDKYINGEVDVLVGGPPCQGFSTIGKRVSSDPDKRKQSDPRNELFREYIKVLKYINPKIFLMENVTGLLTRDKGKIFEEIRRGFEATGYEFDYVVLNAADYGVPQIRNRVFFYGNRIGAKIEPPKPLCSENGETPWKTVAEAIGDLADIANDERINHVPLKHGPINVRRYQMIPEGGRMDERDLPVDLYRRNFGNTFKRLHRNRPSLTMVPGHNAFPIHPWLDRSLTVREAARIQTFPDDYIFVGPRDRQCMQVGNAVPPLLAKVWADYLKEVLDKHYAEQE
jgi:DNA (cytosine-5)-methyltransferase 1